ncbi:MAG TPA: hypothetical protein VEL75_15360 [Candidatus Methylomirabilis sp.]|nr:hypothetical protein [Candidatus Methylomirabilis sp.]
MGVYSELRGFVLVHRDCGPLRGDAEPETSTGYRLSVVCACGARFDRWVTAEDPEAIRLRSALQAFEA